MTYPCSMPSSLSAGSMQPSAVSLRTRQVHQATNKPIKCNTVQKHMHCTIAVRIQSMTNATCSYKLAPASLWPAQAASGNTQLQRDNPHATQAPQVVYKQQACPHKPQTSRVRQAHDDILLAAARATSRAQAVVPECLCSEAVEHRRTHISTHQRVSAKVLP